MAKELSYSRASVAKRLKRRGIISSPRGIETNELIALWEKYKEHPVVVAKGMKQPPTNYEQVINILDNFAEQFDSFFIGRFRNAWKESDEIHTFKLRIREDLINADPNFIPHEIQIQDDVDSDWLVGGEINMYPEDVIDYLKAMFYDYLK